MSLYLSGTLTQASAKLQALRIEARLVENVNPQTVGITTDMLRESVGQGYKILTNTPLSEKWQIPRFRGKGCAFPMDSTDHHNAGRHRHQLPLHTIDLYFTCSP